MTTMCLQQFEAHIEAGGTIMSLDDLKRPADKIKHDIDMKATALSVCVWRDFYIIKLVVQKLIHFLPQRSIDKGSKFAGT